MFNYYSPNRNLSITKYTQNKYPTKSNERKLQDIAKTHKAKHPMPYQTLNKQPLRHNKQQI